MYIMPLWTGLILSFFMIKNEKKINLNDKFTRLTNNPAEGRFNIVKNVIFKRERKKKRRIVLSQFTKSLKFDIQALTKLK